jgi:hypothetical protein
VFRKHARRTLGRQRIGKTLAFYDVKAGYRAIEIETVTLGVAGNDSCGAAGNVDDIGVEGHEQGEAALREDKIGPSRELSVMESISITQCV